jgi:hypothetical protein
MPMEEAAMKALARLMTTKQAPPASGSAATSF